MCVDKEMAIASAYGTGIRIAGLGSFRPKLVMKVRIHFPLDILILISWLPYSLIPVVMSGIIAVNARRFGPKIWLIYVLVSLINHVSLS